MGAMQVLTPRCWTMSTSHFIMFQLPDYQARTVTVCTLGSNTRIEILCFLAPGLSSIKCSCHCLHMRRDSHVHLKFLSETGNAGKRPRKAFCCLCGLVSGLSELTPMKQSKMPGMKSALRGSHLCPFRELCLHLGVCWL